jgi:hypothetical protein
MSHKLSMKLIAGAAARRFFRAPPLLPASRLFSQGSGLGNAYAGSAAKSSDASTILLQPRWHDAAAGARGFGSVWRWHGRSSSSRMTIREVGAFNRRRRWRRCRAVGRGTECLHLSWALNKDLYIGIAIGAPFGQTDRAMTFPWKGSAQSNEFDIKLPSISIRRSPIASTSMFSIGAGFSWQHLSADYYKRLTIGATAGVKDHLQHSPTMAGVGTSVSCSRRRASTKVGLSYRSRNPVPHGWQELRHRHGRHQRSPGSRSDCRAGVQSKAKADITSCRQTGNPERRAEARAIKWELLGRHFVDGLEFDRASRRSITVREPRNGQIPADAAGRVSGYLPLCPREPTYSLLRFAQPSSSASPTTKLSRQERRRPGCRRCPTTTASGLPSGQQVEAGSVTQTHRSGADVRVHQGCQDQPHRGGAGYAQRRLQQLGRLGLSAASIRLPSDPAAQLLDKAPDAGAFFFGQHR